MEVEDMLEALLLSTATVAGIILVMQWKRAQSDALRAAGLAPSQANKAGPGAVFDTRVQSGGRAHHIVSFGRFGRGMDMNRRTADGRITPHWGVDITAPALAPVHAALDGIVILVEPVDGYGNAVAISHPQTGESTVYGHLTRATVSVGDRVAGGQLVGLVGRTCSVPGHPVPSWCPNMGNHLHFEVHPAPRPNFSPTYRRTDPVRWLQSKNIAYVAWEMSPTILARTQNFGEL